MSHSDLREFKQIKGTCFESNILNVISYNEKGSGSFDVSNSELKLNLFSHERNWHFVKEGNKGFVQPGQSFHL